MNLHLCFLLALIAGSALHADIHLRGVLQRDGKYVVGLWDSHERHTSIEWVTVGATFAGFTVEGYDLARDSVRLKKGDLAIEATPSAPARIAPPLFEASKVVVQNDRRLCALHGEPLLVASGFVTRPTVHVLRSRAVFVATMRYGSEFPNTFGIGREPDLFSSVEVRKEFCMACEKALLVWTASRPHAARQ